MVGSPAALPAHIDFLSGGHRFDAVPLHLSGDRASLSLPVPPWGAKAVELVLGWRDGRVTELEGRVRAVESNGSVHLDLRGVGGGWEPFVEYLGATQVKFDDPDRGLAA